MSCENIAKNSEERYIKDLKKAVLLKIMAAASPSPDIMTEADRKLSKLYQEMSDYSGKAAKTIIRETEEKFSEEWQRETEGLLKKSKSLYEYRQNKYREVKLLLKYMDKERQEERS